MRLSIRFLMLLLPVLAVVVVVFNAIIIPLERSWALRDHENRARLIFDSIQEPMIEAVAISQIRGAGNF